MTGQILIERWANWLKQWVVLTDSQALVCALWAMHTWVLRSFAATPYLEISTVSKQSGKTTLLEALSLLARNAQLFSTVRMLTVVRMIEAYDGDVTVGIDEAEKLGSARLDETRTMLATGYRRGQYHAVSVGAKFRKFPTFAPKMFALIGNLQPILRDRSIPIYLERAVPPRMLTNDREVAEEQATELVADFRQAWNTLVVAHGRVPIVDPLWLTSPRDREIWTPIFSVASFLGLHKATMDMLAAASVDMAMLKTLPSRAYHSAQDEQDADERIAADRVLRDATSVLQGGEAAVFTAVLIDRLRAIPTAPWRSWRGAGLNEITFAALLSRFGVEPRLVQSGKGRKERKVARGYRAQDLRAALAKLG